MYRVFTCLFEQHNLWLVGVAAIVCIAACVGAFYVLGSVGHGKGRSKWLFLSSVLAGGGTWATHFVAMLGYAPGLPITFDLPITLLSAFICIAIAWVAFELFHRGGSAKTRLAAGVGLGVAIAAMHYIGMAGLHTPALRFWSPELVIASVFFSCAFAIGALETFVQAPKRFRLPGASAILVLGIVSLHFTAMGALTLSSDPRIVVPSGEIDHDLLAAVIAGGAAAMLLVGVVLAFADRQLTTMKLAAAEQAAAMALHDALTGLPNRRYLESAIEKRLGACSESDRLAVIAVDLDRFKPVNDLYGHAVGDELLVHIAKLLASEAGEQGFVARLGGDEFVMLLPVTTEDALIARLAALVHSFDAPFAVAGNEISVGATLGVALAPGDGVGADMLMRRADVALYRAKEDGRGRYAFFEAGMDERVHERAALERDLRSAIRNDEIEAHFQPFVTLTTGAITGYEILARWTHPTRGAIPPTVFIKIAEETGQVGELCLNVLRRACTQSRTWPGAPTISLNIAAIQLRDAALPQKLLKVLVECGFPPQRLEIEITEDALVSDFDAARDILTSLKNLGVSVALDDFGTGYSSLRHLRELPFDELKIDRSFVHSMHDSEEALTIVRTIVQLAHSLGLGVTAEGVETEEQARALQALGCQTGQGFLLGRPGAEPVRSIVAETNELAGAA